MQPPQVNGGGSTFADTELNNFGNFPSGGDNNIASAVTPEFGQTVDDAFADFESSPFGAKSQSPKVIVVVDSTFEFLKYIYSVRVNICITRGYFYVQVTGKGKAYFGPFLGIILFVKIFFGKVI